MPRLTNKRVCQCPLCFEFFSGERTFALHRIEGQKVNARPGKYVLGHCRPPESKGMALNEHGIWTRPTDPESYLGKLNSERRGA